MDEQEDEGVEYGILDIENVGEPWPGAGELLCVGWKEAGLEGRAYTPDELDESGIGQVVLDRLADPSVAKVVFTKHDHRWLGLRGYKIAGQVVDVQAMAWTVNENTDLDLETCARLYAHVTMDKRIVQRANRPYFKCDDGTVVPLEDAPTDQLLAYNERDLEATEKTFLALLRLLHFEGLGEHWERDVLPFSQTLLNMELRGIPVDVAASRALRETLEDEMERLDDSLHLQAGLPDDFNLGSPPQLGLYLFNRTFEMKRSLPITPEQRASLKAGERDGLPAGFEIGKVGQRYVHGLQTLSGRGLRSHKKTDSGAPATDAKTLKVYHGDDEWVKDLLELSSRRTVVGTFLSAFEEREHEGRLYGRFNQTGTATGRLSSSQPNLQNIPSRGPLGLAVRKLFVPQAGDVFVHGDYSQLEPRIMAHWSGDPVLMRVYEEGLDLYVETAQEVFGERVDPSSPKRRLMKTYVLALGYGSGPETLRFTLAIDGFFVPLHEVKDTFEKLQRVYRVFFEWKEDTISDAQEEGYVETLSGHRRRIAFGRASNWREAQNGRQGRQAANAKIQGSAADVVERAMLGIEREFGNDPRLIVQVHDELLLEARRGLLLRRPDALERIESIATREHGFDLRVPLEFKPRIIRSWAEGKD